MLYPIFGYSIFRLHIVSEAFLWYNKATKGAERMPEIIPIRDLKNTNAISQRCHETQEPIFVTKNGYGDMVIMSMETYEMNIKRLKLYRDIEISENQIKNGKVKDAEKSLNALRNKYGL